MFGGIFELIYRIIEEIGSYIYFLVGPTFGDYTFNIYLFSDTGWFSPSIPFPDLSVMIFSLFIFIFILRLLWKGTKKFINMIFGVFRV